MGRGKTLTKVERAQVDVLNNENCSMREIARRLRRSDYVIRNYLRNKENYDQKRKGRTATATTERERRKILRIASNSAATARQIRDVVGTSASVRTVQRILKKSPHIRRLKLKKKPVLTARHKENRLQFARQHIQWGETWKRVVFTDEKRFSLDGPDGCRYYWHDLRKEPKVISRRPQGGGGVMVWGAISYSGAVQIIFIEGSLNAQKYLELMQSVRGIIRNKMDTDEFIFQQDNAPAHSARVVKQWFDESGTTLLPWPPLSPDLNIIENVWGWLSRKIYSDGKQFNNKQQLKVAIREAWEELPLEFVQNLYNSLPNRMLEVISKNGNHTHY